MVATRAGRRETVRFGPLDIAWTRGLLEPRPWTALQSGWASDLLRALPPGPVLELCAGAGQIGLLAVLDHPDRQLVAVDRNPLACHFAEENAHAAGLAERVSVREGPLTEVLAADERFPLVVADPPWVPHQQVGLYPEDPPPAIDGGLDGMEVARACVALAAAHLADGGSCLLQLGDENQVRVLEHWLACPSGPAMAVVETRLHPRGALVRLARRGDGLSC